MLTHTPPNRGFISTLFVFIFLFFLECTSEHFGAATAATACSQFVNFHQFIASHTRFCRDCGLMDKLKRGS